MILKSLKDWGCYQSQNYKIWKQFTTVVSSAIIFCSLLSITKLQNLKAIHNLSTLARYSCIVVINHKTTKFESNSQHFFLCALTHFRCYQSQNYEIWKQFTTICRMLSPWEGLLSITKLQNLKAIHNPQWLVWPTALVVINHKTTKFESNSQHDFADINHNHGCYQSQNYEIWKQFTTNAFACIKVVMLLSITKLQNLKAIHNMGILPRKFTYVVINHKTTKFESNSQLEGHKLYMNRSCYQSQNYKIWKQFTTS